jgi:hypothetical protein
MTAPDARPQHDIPTYVASATDKIGPPAAYLSEERYLGYRAEDWKKPYARYFQSRPRSPHPSVMAAVHRGPVPPSDVVPVKDCAREMSKPGYLALETGYGVTYDGQACVACLTEMPGIAPAMWAWWFGWHMAESARYKLWHPTAHLFTAPGNACSDRTDLTASQKYIGNVSYIDEYIGSRLMRLAVRFVEPQRLGFPADSADSVTIVGRGGPSSAPVTAVWLIHQIRRTAHGAQMRSRFYMGPPQPLQGVLMAASPTGTAQAEPNPAHLL